MKIIHKNQSRKFKNGKNCIATEYPLGDKNISGAVIKLTGRYPEKGEMVNLKCKELAYIVSGSGKVMVGKKEIKLNKDDVILIEPRENIFWDGKMVMFVSSTPAWHPEQHKKGEKIRRFLPTEK